MSGYKLRDTTRVDYRDLANAKTVTKKHKGVIDLVQTNVEIESVSSVNRKFNSSARVNISATDNDHSTTSKMSTLEEKQQQLADMEAEEALLDVELKMAEKLRAMEEKRARIEALKSAPTAPAVPQYQPSNDSGLREPRGDEQSETITPASLAKDKNLQAALDALKNSHLNNLLTDNEHDVQTAHSGKCTPLFITDFVKKPNASTRQREQNLGRGLILKDSKTRIRPEEVTEAQWAGATFRILLEMLNEMDMEDVRQYANYNIQIADYLQVCKTPSVMLLDEDHRMKVHKGGQWDNIDQQQAYFFLQKKEEEKPSLPPRKPWVRPNTHTNGPTDESGKPICLSFNSHEGCYRSFCRFTHSCSVPGCREAHPRHQHHQAGPPRFRGPQH